MPYSVNGIGTGYYGRRDPSVVNGTCQFCNRQTKLSSYETWECICVFFIPLIPIKRWRILNQCAGCRKHHRIPLADFKQRVEAGIGPLKAAVERAPADPEARIKLIQELAAYQMYVQAEAVAREGVAANPGHAQLNYLLARFLALRGDLAGATPVFRQAAAAAPKDADIRLSLGRNLLARKEGAEAVRELAEAWRLAPANLQALYLLAEALVAEKRWSEALDAYQQLSMRNPAMATDRDVLRRMKQCKEALGYPLTDAERKAGRRWWPFGGGGRRTAPTGAGSVSGKRVAVLLGVVVGLGVLATAGAALWKQQHANLWFDNGLKKTVRVTLDGESFDLPPNSPVQKAVRPGDHAIVVASKGPEIERFTARIPTLDLFDALTANRIFIYNVAEAHVYQRETLGYAAAEMNQTYSRQLIAFQRFFEQDDVRYVFEKAPDKIELDSGKGTTTRVAFNVAPYDASQVGLIWFGEGKIKEADDAFRRVLAAEPCSAAAHANRLRTLRAGERFEESLADAHQWLACPNPGVTAHREYQDAQIALGHREDVLAEYQQRLAAHPEEGANHYLYGRLLNDPERALPLYQEATRREPGLAWALAAQGHALLGLERDAEAADALEQALRLPDHDPAVAVLYAVAAIGAGTAEKGAEVLKAAVSNRNESFAAWQARWLLLLARGEYDIAAKQLEALSRQAGERDAEVWALKTQLLRMRGDEAGMTRALAEGRMRPETAGLAGVLRQERALGAGKWSDAVAAVDSMKPADASPSSRLFAACALLLSGDGEKAAQRLAALDAALAPGAAQNPETAALLAMVRHLEKRAPAEAVITSARQAGFNLLPTAYFVLAAAREAAGDTAGAAALYEKSRHRAVNLDYPYFAAAARAKALAPAEP